MKPELLTMSAFGPFSDTQHINFNELSQNALFLINGPTGSGKTTILDGICFALYGRTTGNEREGSQMRCDMAPDSLLTELTFQFKLGDVQYRIRRIPEQNRKKKSGDGYTVQKPEAQLYRISIDGEESLLVEAKVSEATNQIEALLGLDVDQFRQVMVLPQGKFRDLLMADSNTREKIFGQLFQTQIYRKIEDKLKLQSSEIRQQVQAQQNRREGVLQAAELQTDKALAERLEALNPQVSQAAENKAQTAKAFLQAQKNYDAAEQLKNQFTQLTEQQSIQGQHLQQKPFIELQEATIKKAIKAANLVPLQSSYDQRKHELQIAEQQLNKCEIALSDANKAQTLFLPQIDSLPQLEDQIIQTEQQKQYLAELQPLFHTKTELVNKHASVTTELNKSKAQQTSIGQQNQTLRQQISSIQAEQPQLQLESAEQLSIQQALNQQQLLIENYQQYDFLQKRKLELDSKLHQAKAHGEQLRQLFEKANTEQQTLQLSWHTNQAAVLAAQLQVGEPCLVCGSLEHPQPAISQGKPPTEMELQSSADATALASDKYHEARRGYVELMQQQKSVVEQQKPIAELLGDVLSQPIAACQTRLAELQHQGSKAVNAADKLVKNQKLLTELNQQEQSFQSQLDSVGVLIQEQLKAVTEVSTQLEELDKRLPESLSTEQQLITAQSENAQKLNEYTEKREKIKQQQIKLTQQVVSAQTACESSIKQQHEMKERLQKASTDFQQALLSSGFDSEDVFTQAVLPDIKLTELKQQVSKYQQDWAVNQAKLKELSELLTDKTAPDTELLEVEQQKTNVQMQQADAHWQQLHAEQSQLNQIQQKLVEVDKIATALEDQYAVIGTLSDVANGKTGNRISLNRFVLSVLLDDVLLDASQRLNMMSKGRYRLIRKEQKSKGNKASGLELEVEDAYTSKVRDVATLSGGESFMAALSMALALSEVVQAYAGGIKLDTLFIDEGFGSLDQDSLELAIRTLMDLQSSGRMVGVISHVSEMKEQITQRIDINKSSSGSCIKLING
ncbi:SMC family ATPase [Parashewanella spongiae]|uniref:Nuclease SbcCD subunit C n=1 Tax=Parashewanella spongiae TaxID=342950 RepID=A0A3A6U448_9GAMM|nr:SMC family ATPase [Parashewanella spongiae]MCL1078962.1 SMC family ATPase [Parashewanella spongiae]RJY18896.1 SMC family ATPase [Parashewanella spongiae]